MVTAPFARSNSVAADFAGKVNRAMPVRGVAVSSVCSPLSNLTR